MNFRALFGFSYSLSIGEQLVLNSVCGYSAAGSSRCPEGQRRGEDPTVGGHPRVGGQSLSRMRKAWVCG